MPHITACRISVQHVLRALVLSAATAIFWQSTVFAQATPAAAQSTSQGAVTVVVTPQAFGPGAKEWIFKVVLDTHSQDLLDNLVASSVLLVDGVEYKPTQWSGAGAGGHHREGLLTFTAPDKAVQSVELRISRPGENAPRVFRWSGASWAEGPLSTTTP